MLNILSTQEGIRTVDGPRKLFVNLTKGLDRIGYPYVVNRHLAAARRLFIHDHHGALWHAARSSARTVAGPNLYHVPSDIPPGVPLEGMLYVQPSQWAKQLWEREGFTTCPIDVWPVGIDTEVFKPSDVRDGDRRVLVYHKLRDLQELVTILGALHAHQLSCSLLEYGRYDEEEFRRQLAQASFVVWHGRPETQGIALQEAMASDVPILLCDSTSLAQATNKYPFSATALAAPATSAPYFDATCGIRITDLAELPGAIVRMQKERHTFRPRSFVERHLSLEGQARAFVGLWERWGLTLEQGMSERAATLEPFQPERGRGLRMAEWALGKLRGKR